MSAQQPPKSDNDPAENQDEQNRQDANYYLKYSGMAFQMGGIILVGVLAGQKLDAWLSTDPYLTVVLALLSIFAALYVSLKDLLVTKKPVDKHK